MKKILKRLIVSAVILLCLFLISLLVFYVFANFIMKGGDDFGQTIIIVFIVLIAGLNPMFGDLDDPLLLFPFAPLVIIYFFIFIIVFSTEERIKFNLKRIIQFLTLIFLICLFFLIIDKIKTVKENKEFIKRQNQYIK